MKSKKYMLTIKFTQPKKGCFSLHYALISLFLLHIYIYLQLILIAIGLELALKGRGSTSTGKTP